MQHQSPSFISNCLKSVVSICTNFLFFCACLCIPSRIACCWIIGQIFIPHNTTQILINILSRQLTHNYSSHIYPNKYISKYKVSHQYFLLCVLGTQHLPSQCSWPAGHLARSSPFSLVHGHPESRTQVSCPDTVKLDGCWRRTFHWPFSAHDVRLAQSWFLQ